MSGSGSETRQRTRDLRIRLLETEVHQLDNLVRGHGYHGDHARGDWLRDQLLGISRQPAPPPVPRAVSPWTEAIAAMDRLASEAERLHTLVERMHTGKLHFEDLERLQRTLPSRIDHLLTTATALFDGMHARLEEK